jgi:hypothetical protein
MSEAPLDVLGSYFIKHTTRTVRANVEGVHGRIDLDALAEVPAARLELNDIGRLVVSCNQPIFFDPYVDNRGVGAFVLIDAFTNNTVGAGMIIGAVIDEGDDDGGEATLASAVPRAKRRERHGHAPRAVAFGATGQGAPAQAALARELERALFDAGFATTLVDVQRLSDATRSPAAIVDVVSQCVDAGLVTILSTGLPRVAQKSALEKRLRRRLLWVPEDAPDDVQGLTKWVLGQLRDGD